MPTIEEYIISCKKTLEPYIENYLTDLIEDRAAADDRLAFLYETFKEAGKGGKCIRGSLVKLGYEITVNHQAGDEILPACAAFEVLQTAILGHDDVIDKSPLRRGRDSIWRAIERKTAARSTEGEARHYGISQAICLGDVGISLANRLIIESGFSADKKIDALKTFLDVQLNTVDGEMLDVLASYEKDYADEESIWKIAALKTAWYTIAGPLRLGAALGGASPELMDAIRRYGICLGIAFQLKDDILGITAAEAEIGKSNTSDIAEGKVTLLAHHAIKMAAPEQLEQLKCIYGSGTVSETDQRTVRDIFESTGAFAEAAKKVDSYLAEATGIIGEMTNNPEHLSLLAQLGDLMAKRKS